MKYLSFLFYTIVFIIILVPVAIVIFDFFDIPFETYGNYLFWFIALAIFNAILPYQPTDIFNAAEETVNKMSKMAADAVSGLSNGSTVTVTKELFTSTKDADKAIKNLQKK